MFFQKEIFNANKWLRSHVRKLKKKRQERKETKRGEKRNKDKIRIHKEEIDRLKTMTQEFEEKANGFERNLLKPKGEAN